MRRILLGISCTCALVIAPAAIAAEANPQGAPVASHAPSPTVAAEPGSTLRAGGGAAVVQNGASVTTPAERPGVTTNAEAVRTSQAAPRTTPAARQVDIPQGAEGTGARRIDRPEDLGLRGGAYDQIVTIDINNKDVEDVIRLIGAKGKINILFNPEQVEGTITLHLEDVPLGVALEQILRVNGLGYVREPGNILRIVPSEQVGQADIILEHEVIVLNWVKAPDLQETLQPFISQQGQIQANDENNSIVVTDTPPNIETIRQLVAELDVPEKQVMIEMHLVDVGEDFQKQHGINWEAFPIEDQDILSPVTTAIPGGFIPDPANPGSFIPDPLNPARTITEMVKTGTQTVRDRNPFTSPLGSISDGADFSSVPLSGTAVSTLSIGDEVDLFGQRYWIGADIQADAVQNYAQVLANPRVITLNNLEARIRIEEQIPYIQATTSTGAGGITTEQIVFQDAGQEVTITPTITANGFIRMQIELNQKIFRTRVGGGPLSPPQIDEREAETTAIVQDGKTIALGGLEGHRLLDRKEGTPWLMNVPFFRWFFQTKSSFVTKSTLYLFVRPKIVSVENADLKESEKYWFDAVERNWEMPNEFFENWPEHWGEEKGD